MSALPVTESFKFSSLVCPLFRGRFSTKLLPRVGEEMIGAGELTKVGLSRTTMVGKDLNETIAGSKQISVGINQSETIGGRVMVSADYLPVFSFLPAKTGVHIEVQDFQWPHCPIRFRSLQKDFPGLRRAVR